MLAVNQGRASALSSPVPLAIWIAWRGYRTDFEDKPLDNPPRSSFGNTDYYQELVFHAAMLSPDLFLLWSACRWRQDQKAEDWCQQKHLKLLDQMLSQVNGLVGYSDRKTLVESLAPWHAPFLLSGCVGNGQSVWRLTPDPQQSPVELAKILKSEQPLTFVIGNQTLVLPGGKVIQPEPALSTVGYLDRGSGRYAARGRRSIALRGPLGSVMAVAGTIHAPRPPQTPGTDAGRAEPGA